MGPFGGGPFWTPWAGILKVSFLVENSKKTSNLGQGRGTLLILAKKFAKIEGIFSLSGWRKTEIFIVFFIFLNYEKYNLYKKYNAKNLFYKIKNLSPQRLTFYKTIKNFFKLFYIFFLKIFIIL